MRKISSSSTRPTSLRRSCRCVPSAQSKRRRSPPRRTSVALSARFAVGIEPDVPRKTTSSSTAVESRRGTQRQPCASRYTGHAAHAGLPLVRAAAFPDAAPDVPHRIGGDSRRRCRRALVDALRRSARRRARRQRARRLRVHGRGRRAGRHPRERRASSPKGRCAALDVRLPNDVRGLNVYARDGRLVFSTTHPERVGRRRSSPELRQAIETGAPSADLVDPMGKQPPVVKVWAPLHTSRGGVVGAAEVALDDSVVTQIIDDTRGTVWLAVGIVFGVLWLVLALLVRGASARLRVQNEDLATRSHDLVESSRAARRRRCSRPSRRSTPRSRRAIRTPPVTHSESGGSRSRSDASSGFPRGSSARSQRPLSSTTSGRSGCRTRS